MAESHSAPNDPDTTLPLWQRFAFVFENRHATVSVHELPDKQELSGATEEEIADTVEWALDRQLVEADESDESLRLTPQGRRLWRELMGEV